MNKKKQSNEDRFWSKVTKTHSCWLWTGSKRGSRAQFALEGTTVSASKYAYFLKTGKMQKARVSLKHMCDAVLCVNPDHMEFREFDKKPEKPEKLTAEFCQQSGHIGAFEKQTALSRNARIQRYRDLGLLSSFTEHEIQNLGRKSA